jgi:hypothetical protein
MNNDAWFALIFWPLCYIGAILLINWMNKRHIVTWTDLWRAVRKKLK